MKYGVVASCEGCPIAGSNLGKAEGEGERVVSGRGVCGRGKEAVDQELRVAHEPDAVRSVVGGLLGRRGRRIRCVVVRHRVRGKGMKTVADSWSAGGRIYSRRKRDAFLGPQNRTCSGNRWEVDRSV